MDRSILVIGVGNPERGDDAAGRLVARRLAPALAGRARVVEHDGEAAGLVETLGSAALALVVDACASGAPAGTVSRFDVSAGPLPARGQGLSSHGLGLADALELARVLGRLPARCIVYAIEGSSFASGAAPSRAVVSAVEDVARRITEEVSTGGAGCTKPR